MAKAINQNIIEALGLDKLPAEEQAEILMDMSRIVYQNIMLRVINEIKEEDKDEVDAFLEKNADNQEAVYEFFKSKVPNIDEIAKEEVEKLQKDNLDFANMIKQ